MHNLILTNSLIIFQKQLFASVLLARYCKKFSIFLGKTPRKTTILHKTSKCNGYDITK